MGNNSSTQQQFESTDSAQTPIRFSTSLINDLSDELTSETKNQPNQITLDEQIRNRINAELNRLRSEEHSVRQQIEQHLAQDNASKSKQDDQSILSSESVKRSIDDIKLKIDRHHSKRDMNNFASIKQSHNDLITCFRDNKDTPLDCYVQIDHFKQAVSDAEKTFIKTLQ